ncbi:hypothetical protein NS07_v2contig00181-0010 [Nocardia seriolae]|nr:hypothetical protein NS07_v2contig00181-0010 [Nocardia seriolae]
MQGFAIGVGKADRVLEEEFAGGAGAGWEVGGDLPDQADRDVGGRTDLGQAGIHGVDQVVGLTNAGGEVAAGVAGEGAVEEAVLAVGDLLLGLVGLGAQDAQQFGRADPDAVDDGGENLCAAVGFEVQIGAGGQGGAAFVDGGGQAVEGVADIVLRVRDRRPGRGDQAGRVAGGAHAFRTGQGGAEGCEVGDLAVGSQRARSKMPEAVGQLVAGNGGGIAGLDVGLVSALQFSSQTGQFGERALFGGALGIEFGEPVAHLAQAGEDLAVVQTHRRLDLGEFGGQRAMLVLGRYRLRLPLVGQLGRAFQPICPLGGDIRQPAPIPAGVEPGLGRILEGVQSGGNALQSSRIRWQATLCSQRGQRQQRRPHRLLTGGHIRDPVADDTIGRPQVRFGLGERRLSGEHGVVCGASGDLGGYRGAAIGQPAQPLGKRREGAIQGRDRGVQFPDAAFPDTLPGECADKHRLRLDPRTAETAHPPMPVGGNDGHRLGQAVGRHRPLGQPVTEGDGRQQPVHRLGRDRRDRHRHQDLGQRSTGDGRQRRW